MPSRVIQMSKAASRIKALTCYDSELVLEQRILQTFSTTPWTRDQPFTRPLPTQENTTQKLGHTSVLRSVLILATERFKTERAMNHAATVASGRQLSQSFESSVTLRSKGPLS
jgi:hypothetical protein